MPGTSAIVLGVSDLNASTDFFVANGFRVTSLIPADDPQATTLEGHGLTIRLDRSVTPTGGRIEIGAVVDGGTSPDGVEVVAVLATDGHQLPDLVPEVVVTHPGDGWGEGRAAMLYRDLIPGRQGGRFIASHIKIPNGGPVPDSVHYHRIRFQMLYCYKGWVRVLYEDQGESFVLEPGDAVLQPPEIRHQVLESSDGFEIIEIGCPAEHDTFFDHELELPTATVDPARDFGGQRFVHHVAAAAVWAPAAAGAERRDLGIGAATVGLAEAAVVRLDGSAPVDLGHDGEFSFSFVLDGSLAAHIDGHQHQLEAGAAITIPAGVSAQLTPSGSADLLQITLP